MVNQTKVTAEVQDLIRHYFQQGWSILLTQYCLLTRHGINISVSYLEKVVYPRMGLCRKGRNMTPLEDVLLIYMDELPNGANISSSVKYMLNFLRTKYGLNVARSTIRSFHDFFLGELVGRRKRKRLNRRSYRWQGPDMVWHIDGYDKLSPYGICIHGCMDGFSRQMIWLQAGVTNHNPRQIATYFLNSVTECGGCPNTIRADHGTENVNVKHCQELLTEDVRPPGMGPFLSGSSTHNQRIERFWGLLRLWRIDWWRSHFKDFVFRGQLVQGDPVDKMLIPFCYMDKVQADLALTLQYNNAHVIRNQKEGDVVTGIPDVMYRNPELYDTRSYLLPVDPVYVRAAKDVLSDNIPLDGDFIALAQHLCQVHRLNPHTNNVDEADALFLALRPRIRDVIL